MATIKLKKPPAGSAPREPRPPVRGTGSAPRKRPTEAEAKAAREARAARRDEEVRREQEPRRAGPRRDEDPRRAPLRRDEDPRRAPPRRAEEPRRDPRAAPPARPRPAPQRPELPPARGGNTAFGGPPRERRVLEPARPVERDPQRRPTRDDPPDAPRHQGPTPSAYRRTGPPAAPTDEPFDNSSDTPGSMRLSKRMSELGIASRREADEWIPKGWVRVDGVVVSELGSRVTPEQRITIDAKARHQQAQRVTILLNKPVGYVSGQAEDGYEPASVLITAANQWKEDQSGIRFLLSHLRSLAPAGRLDIDSVGLLVLTQDGRIAKQLIGEDRDTEKEYLVRVERSAEGRLPAADLALLNHGLELDGEPLLPAKVEWINDDQLRFVLKEGKKRQIRRMCEAVGLKVVGLKRVRIGKVMLGDLPAGQWRYLGMTESF